MSIFEKFAKNFADFCWSININPLIIALFLLGLMTYFCKDLFKKWYDLDFSIKLNLILILMVDFLVLIGTIAYFIKE